ncbi:DUF4184 family protein [Actinokineospora sp. NBRC 105648]|uniref:DUF4184 family protein n=1 Tax=Actinokineospora sp. NBRC 105648 TaxID=3032206 RepID=UPI0025536A2F|nr:DUF4184 family protein [Actinokineospora sp. NBRC 105648]
MPYTLSHAAAVLPLLRRGPLVGSALVVGSFSPDLLYFIALEPGVDDRSHTWLGLLWIDLPVALAVLALYHALVVPAVLALVPGWLRIRLVDHVAPPRLGVVAVGWVVVSVLVGGVTHLVWDAFTHHTGWGVEHWPSLRLWLWEGMPRYNFLQYLSSVVGAVLVVVWWRRTLRRAVPATEVPPLYAPPRRPGLVVGAVVASGVVLAVYRAVTVMAGVGGQSVMGFAHTLAAGVPPTHTQLAAGLARVSICLVTGAFVALLVVGLRQRIRARQPA